MSHNPGRSKVCANACSCCAAPVAADAPPRPVIAEYERTLSEAPPLSARLQAVNASPAARILGVTLFDGDGNRTSTFATGSPVRAEVEFVAEVPVEDAVIEVYFYSVFDNMHCHFSTEHGGGPIDLVPGRGTVEFLCPEIGLTVAAFNVEASIKRRGAAFDQHRLPACRGPRSARQPVLARIMVRTLGRQHSDDRLA